MRRTVPPSAEIEARIEHMLSVGVGENPRESLSELARLGARLIIQRAVEDEFDAWLGRARYELPIGALFCVTDGPTRGRPWSATAARGELRRYAAAAGVRRRFAPHHYADPWVMPMSPRAALCDLDFAPMGSA